CRRSPDLRPRVAHHVRRLLPAGGVHPGDRTRTGGHDRVLDPDPSRRTDLDVGVRRVPDRPHARGALPRWIRGRGRVDLAARRVAVGHHPPDPTGRISPSNHRPSGVVVAGGRWGGVWATSSAAAGVVVAGGRWGGVGATSSAAGFGAHGPDGLPSLAAMRFAPDRPLGLAPATIGDYRELARRRLPRQLFDYIDGGAYDESTMRDNVADLERIRLRQRVMVDVDTRSTATTVLGEELAMPVILGPVGLAGMFAPRAEVQAIRAATAAGVPFVESTVSICGLDEVARASAKPPWFQLYVMRDRDFAEGLMQQAGDVGSPVLVLTVDLAVVGARFRDVRNAMVGDVGPGGAIRRGLDLASHPRWIKEVALGGKPLTFG